MKKKRVAFIVALLAIADSNALADPTLTVTYDGLNGSGNHTWTAFVGPDTSLFYDTTSGFGSSMAVELAFAVRDSEFVDVTVNTTNWDFANPGNNPFTGTVTDGTWISADNTLVFGAHGSPVFTTAGPFELFSFETLGSQFTTIDYGVAASGHSSKGALIAQSGLIFNPNIDSGAESDGRANGTGGTPTLFEFTGYSGSESSLRMGDGNLDGRIDAEDAQVLSSLLIDNTLLGVLLESGRHATGNFKDSFDFYTEGAPPNQRVIDFDDIPGFVNALAEFQNTSLQSAYGVFNEAYAQVLAQAIPEPAAVVTAVILIAGMSVKRRRRPSSD